jgi:hypothetical protein
MTTPETPREPTGLEWASLDDICEELHRRYPSFLLTALGDHKVDNTLYTRIVRYADSMGALSLGVLAVRMLEAELLHGIGGLDA